MLYQDALALIAAHQCLQVQRVIPQSMHAASVTSGVIEDGDLTTWLAKDAWRFTLIKTKENTLVYCHSTDFLYYAQPQAMLTMECPESHAFLVQVLEDIHDEIKTPRVLVMDMVLPLVNSPAKRGEILRSLSHVFPPVCHLQWAGNKIALKNFLDRGLPHPVECMVAMRSNPLQLVKEMDGSLPASLQAMEGLLPAARKRKAPPS